ncbi:hypothetical protein GYA93_19600 [Gordonia desulfuricans]|uniref:Uncharacterized protein n=1 Tax=Gordonia desulfuricans TaxID=89051 RepID=A0A7K3LU21_9ACTN|nr:hypothetical protein [Gordonia desulfuricans]NDK91760.1 hypothetical protein [Gordonia desulfuricans]
MTPRSTSLGQQLKNSMLTQLEQIDAPAGMEWRVVSFRRWMQHADSGATVVRLDVKDGDEVSDLYLVAATASDAPAPRSLRPAEPAPSRRSPRAPIPQCRLDLIAWLEAHPGEWAEYVAAGDEDVSAPQIAKCVRSGSGGFGPGFSVRTRGSRFTRVSAFVRYDPVSAGRPA